MPEVDPKHHHCCASVKFAATDYDGVVHFGKGIYFVTAPCISLGTVILVDTHLYDDGGHPCQAHHIGR